MTVLFVDHAPGLGGAEHSLLLLLEHIDRERWPPELVSSGGPLAAEARRLRVPMHTLSLPRLRRFPAAGRDLVQQVRALAAIAERRGARLLHANTVRAAIYCAGASRLSGIPWLWHLRDFWLSESAPRLARVDRMLKGWLGRSAWRVVVNSRAVAERVPLTTTVIHNGIDITSFVPSRTDGAFRARWSLSPSDVVVGMAGRLRPWKGQRAFLHMASQVNQAHPNARFMIVGGTPLGEDDSYTNRLVELRAQLGLEERVTFTGQLTDVRPALAAMDLFIHPGDPEPFGLVTVEAMAMGRPVIAFAHGAAPELIVDGQSGRLIPPHDLDGMARTIADLLAKPETRRRLGAAARARAAQHFDIRRTVAELEALYEQLPHA